MSVKKDDKVTFVIEDIGTGGEAQMLEKVHYLTP